MFRLDVLNSWGKQVFEPCYENSKGSRSPHWYIDVRLLNYRSWIHSNISQSMFNILFDQIYPFPLRFLHVTGLDRVYWVFWNHKVSKDCWNCNENSGHFLRLFKDSADQIQSRISLFSRLSHFVIWPVWAIWNIMPIRRFLSVLYILKRIY